MIQNVRIGTRLTVGMTVTIVLVVGLMLPTVLSTLAATIDRAEQRQLTDLHQTLSAELDAATERAVALITAVAASPDVESAFADRDRARLLELTQPRFEVLKRDFGVVQLQFHLPPAESFLRVHMPEKYGDDLSGFRNTVLQANDNRQVISGLERGVAGIGVRGVIPVAHEGRHLGSAEVGVSFGQPFFERFSDSFDVPVALHIEDGQGGFRVFGGTIAAGSALTDEQKRQVLAGETLVVQRDHDGKPVAVMAQAVEDFAGKPIGVAEILIDRSAYVSSYQRALFSVLGIGAVALLIGVMLSTLVGRTIACPLRKTVEHMDEIAQGEGDLTARLAVNGKDELAELARAFNTFVGHIQDLIRQVSAATSQLSAAAEELSATSEQTSGQVSRQQNEITQVATAMNEMTATVSEVAANAGTASRSADTANVQATDGTRVVSDTVDAIHKLAEEVEGASQNIESLSKDSTRITQVLEVIRDIAEQTNLLALNAAIEAARAGDAGRGFAVVAEEVRTLASRTQKSTVDIQQMIDALQTGASSAVDAMTRSRERAQTTVDCAGQAGQALEQIASGVRAINDMNAQIAHAAEQQAQVAEEINQNISHITDAVDQTASSSTQISAASDELARLALDLQAQIQRFRY
ncbi:MAG: methyl-accepting chemotaxis protein [Halothiobacillaceae bacterium]